MHRARDIFYILFAYLFGSVLFAPLASQLLGKGDITENTPDHNPGTTNAFENGGFWCGLLTLLGDLLKGALPVYLYLHGETTHALALVLAAPVLGHIFSVFHHFHGGKGIATTFGCLLGLIPNLRPVLLLAFFFLLYSLVFRILPHYHRTLVTYLSTELAMRFWASPVLFWGFTLIVAAVCYRLFTSREEKVPFEVELLWKH